MKKLTNRAKESIANRLLAADKPVTKKAKKEDGKPHFFSEEAKKERFEKRMNLIESHLKALIENDHLLPEGLQLGATRLKKAEKLFRRLSLAELVLIQDMLCQCEEVGRVTFSPDSVAESA